MSSALAWDIDRALAAHDAHAPGRIVALAHADADSCTIQPGDTLRMRYGPDAGRTCVFVAWHVRGRSRRVRFPEREAVVPADWAVEA